MAELSLPFEAKYFQANNVIQALGLAITAEKESILFYYEIKELTPERLHPVVNGIITEGKSHLRQLSELKKKLDTR